MSMVHRTDIAFPLEPVRAAAAAVDHLFDRHGVLNVTSYPEAEDPLRQHAGWLPEGLRESQFTVVTEPFRGTAIEALLNALPFRHGRARLLKMAPKSCLSIHWDSSRRWHYAITTNPACYLVHLDGEVGRFHHIPADGHLYEMDARLTHTAINASKEARLHLVIADADDAGAREGSPAGHACRHALT